MGAILSIKVPLKTKATVRVGIDRQTRARRNDKIRDGKNFINFWSNICDTQSLEWLFLVHKSIFLST